MDGPIQLFEEREHAQAYAEHRLVFPDSVVETIKKFIQECGCKCVTAVDVGCGTGHQSTVPLSRFFNNVIGVDISQEQINQAPKDLPNVTFQVGPAEDLSFVQDASVDLVSVATAIHWFDLPSFYQEVDRVLRSGGCLATYWYGNPMFDNKNAQENYDKYYESSEFLHEANKRLWIRHELPECPYGNWLEKVIKVEHKMTIASHISEQETKSYNQMHKRKYQNSLPLENYKQRLIDIYSTGLGENTIITISHNIIVLLCRKGK